MKNILLKVIFLLFIPITLQAQTDTEFWFAVPCATDKHDGPVAAYLRLTSAGNASEVTITQPANPGFAPIIVNLSPNETRTVTFNDNQYDVIAGDGLQFDVITNHALHITSTDEITAYFELTQYNGSFSNYNNPDLFALKGTNALGYKFYVPFQTTWNNHKYNPPEPDYSSIDIVATEDSTEIDIFLRKDAAKGPDGSADYSAGSTITIVLDKGETYSVVPTFDGNNRPSHKTAHRLVGTEITSNKPIAVTIKDDSVQKGGAYDLIGDQLIPVRNVRNKTVIGHEYLIMRGKVGNNNERYYILATENDTRVEINGNYIGYQLQEGIQHTEKILDKTPDNEDFHHIYADKPIYVLHVTGNKNELGGAVLPTIDGCSGSLSTSFVRSKGGSNKLFLNLMTKDYAIDSFKVDIDGVPTPGIIDGTMFEQAGTSGWYVLKNTYKDLSGDIPVGKVTRIYNTAAVFHLGMLNGVTTGGGNMYGYFSDYDQLEAEAFSLETGTPLVQLCGEDSIQLQAKGGLSYHWSPSEYVNDTTAKEPWVYPPKGVITTFSVRVLHPCDGYQTKQVSVLLPEHPYAFLGISKTHGCAPLEVDFTNGASGAIEYVLDYGDTSSHVHTTSHDSINHSHTYYNNSDTVTFYEVQYSVSNLYGCTDVFVDTIWVYPQVNSSFEIANMSDTTGCHPLDVDFYSTSTGNTDYYIWDFGDGASASDSAVYHQFTNTGYKDSTYTVELIAVSPFMCQDTSRHDILVHPFIKASYSVEPSITCSPLITSLNPANSIGVDTFFWHIYDDKGLTDSLYATTNKSPVPLSHIDNTQSSPDTIFIGLVTRNDEGCWDTVPERKITVYPEVHAIFTPTDTNVCDSTQIIFNNNSIGYDLRYDWDFDNGNSSDIEEPSHIFYNRGNNDSVIYNVSLVTWSNEYLCYDTAEVPITVHPFIYADFTVDHQNNCSPLDISIDNTSIAPTGTDFEWDMDDGTVYMLPNKSDVNHTLTNYSDTDERVFNISLNASKGNCSSSFSKEVLVYPRVRPRFSLDRTGGCQPLEVRIINSSEPSLSFNWEFSDGTSTDTTVGSFVKVFENHSSHDTTFDISLTATNDYGCSNDSTRTVEVYSFVEADFALPETDTCSPFRLFVQNDSRGGINDYLWNFGNGDTNTDPVPDYTYHNISDEVQDYGITLRVGNNHGCYDSMMRNVTVYPEVVANFTTSDGVFEDCQPFNVQFENTSNAPAIDFEWDFGDGGGSVMKTPPARSFNNSGSADSVYTVRLYAESAYGCSDVITKDIIAYAYIHSQFGLVDPDSCSPFPVRVQNLSKGGIDKYFWNFGDGSMESNEYQPTHTYRNQSDFVQERNLRLVVKNLHACYDTFVRKVTVYPEVIASFSTADNLYTGCQPFNVEFINNSNYPAKYFIWDFDDGTNAGADNPTKLFRNKTADDKTYSVNLFAESIYQCTDDTTIDITAYAFTEAGFNLSDDDVCYGYPIEIENQSSPGTVQYDWDMDNGTVLHHEDTFSYTWLDDPDGHVFRLKLTARNAHGCIDTISKAVEIYPQVRAHIGLSDTAGCNPLYVSFTNLSENVEFNDKYQWDFGDGNDATIPNPANLFETYETGPTKYKVSLRAESDMHCWDTTSTYVTVYPKPDAMFYAYPPTQFYPQSTINIDNLTNHKEIWNYDWDWGDNTIADKKSAPSSHNYGYWGEYDVKLTVWNNYCTDSLTRKVKIYPALPVARFDSTYRGCEPLTVTFYDHSKYGSKHSWNFGDGNSYVSGPGKNKERQLQEYGEEVTHTFENDGLYNVVLTVEGDGGMTQYNQIVEVYPKPEITFDVAPKVVMLPDEKIQTFNSTPVKPEYRYLWNFGDGGHSTDKEPSHLYTELGKYDVSLTMWTEHMCVDSLVKPELVSVEGTGLSEFPNAFIPSLEGPNGGYYDMNNPQSHVFHPYHDGVVDYRLEIYTRWGELVFVSEDVNIGWDGYIDGELAKQDVYIWRVKGTYTNGSSFVKAGDVTLLVAPEGELINHSN